MIQRELPIGSSYDDVVQFLDRRKIQHDSEINHGTGMPDVDNTISGYINPNVRILFITGSLTLTFHFSPQKRLARFEVVQDWGGVP
jgi:hypothetical protein